MRFTLASFRLDTDCFMLIMTNTIIGRVRKFYPMRSAIDSIAEETRG